MQGASCRGGEKRVRVLDVKGIPKHAFGSLGGAATMADRVFVRRIELGHGLGIAGFGHEEDRIIAKAVAAAWPKACLLYTSPSPRD